MYLDFIQAAPMENRPAHDANKGCDLTQVKVFLGHFQLEITRCQPLQKIKLSSVAPVEGLRLTPRRTGCPSFDQTGAVFLRSDVNSCLSAPAPSP
jgi:hypothetical protein